MENKDEIIVATNLAAAYGKNMIWQHANFSVRRGEFVVLLGPNGGGKTTLFHVILGLLKPDSGNIQLFGNAPTKGNPKIGYIPQRRLIDSEMRIQAVEFVTLGVSGTEWGFSMSREKKYEKKGLEALRQINAAELAHRSIGELSGGELQRVFLAQALISNPGLLLLDEPMANLDIRREKDFVDLLSGISKERDVGVLLITHDVNPILPFIDKLLYIANGRVETGTVADVINSERLSDIYGTPVEVLYDSKGRIAVLGIESEVHHD